MDRTGVLPPGYQVAFVEVRLEGGKYCRDIFYVRVDDDHHYCLVNPDDLSKEIVIEDPSVLTITW